MISKIFVICGTQKFQFDRLISALDHQIEEGLVKASVFGQIGGGSYEPTHFPYARFMDDADFKDEIRKADLIVTHSGTGSIVNSLKSGKKVIVVPRLAKYGEHVNDHQLEIAELFEKAGLVMTCGNTDKLFLAIRQAEDFSPAVFHSGTEHVLEVLDKDLQELARAKAEKEK